MKHLLKSIGAGIFVSLIIYMGIAILYAVLTVINNFGGMPYIVGFIFLISVVTLSVLYYYQNK